MIDMPGTPSTNDDSAANTNASATQSKMLKGLIIAIAMAAFFAGYSISTLTESDNGISEEQMRFMLSEIDSMVADSVAEMDAPDTHPTIRITVDDDPIKGNPDAELTIIEFSDFQCPFCLRFYEQTMPLIEQNYVNTGKVNFVYRDFPLQNHQNAMPAHTASECADEQGQFWPYHDMLFERQGEWQSLPPESISKSLVQYADGLGLHVADFESCLNSSSFVQEIQKDYQDGIEYGVRGTPAFFIGNDQDGYVMLSGAQPFSVFQQVIDSRLG